MNADDIAAIIATYLVDRDDFAEAVIVERPKMLETGAVEIRVVTQGSSIFTVTVAP